MIRSYRDLAVWQKAIELAEENHRLCNRLPARERYGLTSQMRRAALSISSNIAEGHNSRKRRRFSNHISIVLGSLAELETQMILCQRFGYLTADDTASFWLLAGSLGRQLSRLRQALETPSVRDR